MEDVDCVAVAVETCQEGGGLTGTEGLGIKFESRRAELTCGCGGRYGSGGGQTEGREGPPGRVRVQPERGGGQTRTDRAG